MNFSVS